MDKVGECDVNWHVLQRLSPVPLIRIHRSEGQRVVYTQDNDQGHSSAKLDIKLIPKLNP